MTHTWIDRWERTTCIYVADKQHRTWFHSLSQKNLCCSVLDVVFLKSNIRRQQPTITTSTRMRQIDENYHNDDDDHDNDDDDDTVQNDEYLIADVR